ncbi:hypothetical protein HYE68_002950 [Fusarium pseudograminearum]|nr:hypothetical protein HYE68_002950 [Fusarium pseudograminearum]
MRSPLLLSTIGYAFFNAIQAFEFTGPDPAKRLNLNQPINITWNATGGRIDEPKAHALDLWFFALVDADRVGGEIATNLSLSSGSYKWDPKTIVQGWKDGDASVSPDAVHYFEAKLVDIAGKHLAGVESTEYALEGFDFIKNGCGKGLQPGLYATVTMALMAGVLASGVI